MNEKLPAIIGVGCTINPGEPHIDKGFKDLIVEASYAAIDNAHISPKQIDGAVFSYTGEGEVGYGGIAPTLVDALGLSPLPAFTDSANCASAHAAFMQGCDMVESGNYDTVLVAGFGKMTDVIPFENYMLLSSDSLFDYRLGYSHIDSFLLGTEYFAKHHINKDIQYQSLLAVAMSARNYGKYNPEAKYFDKISNYYDLKSLPALGCTLASGEGASAIILTKSVKARRKNKVVVHGRSWLSTSHYVGHRYSDQQIMNNQSKAVSDLAEGLPLKIACNRAYKQANLRPTDIDTVQVYDQLVNQFIALEATGICPIGTAPMFYINGEANVNGKCPVNTDGGNIGRGFASGAASLYGIIELYRQLTNTQQGLKIQNPVHHALSTFMGGYYADAGAVILSKMDGDD